MIQERGYLSQDQGVRRFRMTVYNQLVLNSKTEDSKTEASM